MDIITYALCKKADREIIDMIHDMEGMTVQIVDEIPTVQEAQYNVMYLVDTNGDGKYEAYIKAKISGVDQIISLGSIIDLSDFYTKSEIDTALAGKQPLLTWDNVPTSGSSNAISSGAIYTALDKIKIEEMTDTEYAALATKDPDKVYFVYETEEDNRSIVCKDSNGNWKYTTTIIGTTASNVTDNVTAEESTVTTPPTPGFDYWYGSVVFATTTPEKTVYHSMFYFSNNGRAGMRDTASGDGAPDAYFELGTYGSITYHPTPSGSPVSSLYVFSSSHRGSGDTIEFNVNPKPNGFKRIYKGDQLYVTNELPDIAPHIDLTQAQYDALTPATDTIYFITDSDTDINFSDFETRLQNIEENYTLYYVDGSTRVPLTLKNTKNITRIDDNTVEWDILEPTSNKMYKATVTASGTGNVRRNPQIAITEVV